AVAKGSIPRDGLNVPRSGNHFPNAIIVTIRYEDISRTVDREAEGVSQRSAVGGATVTTEALGTVASDGLNRSCGSYHLPDALVPAIRDEDVPGAIDGYVEGSVELGASGGAAIPASALSSLSCHGVNNPRARAPLPLIAIVSVTTE